MSDWNEIETTREFLKSPNNPDIGWIPSSVPEFKSTANSLSEDDSVMLRMTTFGILPRRFLKLRNDLPPRVSCIFCRAHWKPWRHTSSTNKGDTIRRDKKLKAGHIVYTDRLVSAQSGLVPQEKGSATRARIWALPFLSTVLHITQKYIWWKMQLVIPH